MSRLLAYASGVLAALLLTTAVADSQQPRVKRSTYEAELFKKLNEAAIGIAAGQLEGAPLRFATELGRVVDDGDKLRILPVVTRGPFENVHDLLYVRGVDAAIINGDVFEHFKKDGR